jgi:hypothetical protein
MMVQKRMQGKNTSSKHTCSTPLVAELLPSRPPAITGREDQTEETEE